MSDIAPTETSEGRTITEQDHSEMSLLEVARIIHEQGSEIAPNLYSFLEKSFENTKPQPQRPLRSVDLKKQIICRQDRSPSGDLLNERQITAFIGPQTSEEEMIKYPRVTFAFTKRDGEWVYTGALVGIRGSMSGTQRIINEYAESGGVRAYIMNTKISMKDMERVLGEFIQQKSSIQLPRLHESQK